MADDRLIAVTGAGGFIGKNLVCHLKERGYSNIVEIGRMTNASDRHAVFRDAHVVFHLAGVNRPDDPAEFDSGNVGTTKDLCDAIAQSTRTPLIVFASSSKAGDASSYGVSKRGAELALGALAEKAIVLTYRLPNVFGKWSKPNYNSGIATFCYNLARGLPIQVNASAPLTLVYVDDLVEEWGELLARPVLQTALAMPRTTYETTVGAVADILMAFSKSRESGLIDGVGIGLVRALYATYVSFLPADKMAYGIKAHTDARGSFSEMLRTATTGQFSYFTAHPGVTRGGHYHHSKTEKFLVLAGKARFRFRHILSNEIQEVMTEGGKPTIVETLPGWAHDITNVGQDTLICMLWANELFDPTKPDTFAAKVF